MNSAYDTVVIPIETSARELLPKLLLSLALVERGFTTYIGTKSVVQNVAERIGRVIYLDKGYHRGVSEGVFERLHRHGCLVVTLDEENGIDYKDFHMLDVRMPDDFLTLVDHVLVWGNAQLEHLRANRQSFDPQKISVTGHPRFDLVKPECRPLYQGKVDEIRKQYGPYVLLNTSSKYSNNIRGRAFIIENYSSRVKKLAERLEYDDKRVEKNIELARRIAIETGTNVILRPHPEERLSTYQEAFKDLPNVQAIYEDTAIYWILASEIVIHNQSTTGMEAAMLGRTPISYNPVPREKGFTPWIPIACSLAMDDENMILDYIKTPPSRRPPAPDVAEILENFFCFSRDATPVTADTLERIANGRKFMPATAPRGLGFYPLELKLRELWRRLRGDDGLDDLSRNKTQDLRPDVMRARFGQLLDLRAPRAAVQMEVLASQLYRIGPR